MTVNDAKFTYGEFLTRCVALSDRRPRSMYFVIVMPMARFLRLFERDAEVHRARLPGVHAEHSAGGAALPGVHGRDRPRDGALDGGALAPAGVTAGNHGQVSVITIRH